MKGLAYLALLLAILGLQACTNSSKQADKSLGTSGNKNDSTAIIKNGDGEFLANAARGSMAEIELGKLAQANSSNGRIKKFGAMMETDHSKASERLKTLASSKNILLPERLDEESKKHADRLKDRKGAAFDLTYMKLMVRDHRRDVKKFKSAASDAVDPDVKSFARETLPVLQKHLDSAKAIYNMLKPPLDEVIVP